MLNISTEEMLDLLNRRQFLKGSAALAAVPLMPWHALAQTEPYSFIQGEAEVFVVSDGRLDIPFQILAPEASPEQIVEIARRLGEATDAAHVAANVVLVRQGDDLIMFDNGSGGNFSPLAGKLAENMVAAGIDPALVTKVIFTHAHPDHIFGTLTKHGSLLCPKASYYVAEAEWNHWTDPDLLSQSPAEMGNMIKGAQRNLSAVRERVILIQGAQEFISGISAIDTAGHTPGHLSFLLAGGGGLILTADAAVHQIVSLEHPEWRFGFDAIPELAARNRKALLDRAATDGIKLLGYHWPYPGLGFAEKRNSAYRYVPV